MRRLIAIAALAAVLLLAAATAFGAKNGITPISPKQGDTVPAGTAPTFKMNATAGRGVDLRARLQERARRTPTA